MTDEEKKEFVLDWLSNRDNLVLYVIKTIEIQMNHDNENITSYYNLIQSVINS